jgi:hypothetical protein
MKDVDIDNDAVGREHRPARITNAHSEGGCGGTLATGQHIRYARNTPIANLYLELLDRMGTRADSFGDSTGLLGNLA